MTLSVDYPKVPAEDGKKTSTKPAVGAILKGNDGKTLVKGLKGNVAVVLQAQKKIFKTRKPVENTDAVSVDA